MLKILPIVLLSSCSAQKSSLLCFRLCLAKYCLIAVFCYFTDCSIRVRDFSIRVSQSGCCKACLAPKESIYSHIFSFNNEVGCIKAKSLTNALFSLVKISKIVPIMLALCLMPLVAYYAYYYAGIIDRSLLVMVTQWLERKWDCKKLMTFFALNFWLC